MLISVGVLWGVSLAGCERDEPWVWRGSGTAPSVAPDVATRAAPMGVGEPASDPSVVVFSSPGFELGERSELTRRDGLMGVRADEAIPDRLGWARGPRPDLSRTRTLRGSTYDRWVYPTVRDERGDRRPYGTRRDR